MVRRRVSSFLSMKYGPSTPIFPYFVRWTTCLTTKTIIELPFSYSCPIVSPVRVPEALVPTDIRVVTVHWNPLTELKRIGIEGENILHPYSYHRWTIWTKLLILYVISLTRIEYELYITNNYYSRM